jgi:hypothetical protein
MRSSSPRTHDGRRPPTPMSQYHDPMSQWWVDDDDGPPPLVTDSSEDRTPRPIPDDTSSSSEEDGDADWCRDSENFNDQMELARAGRPGPWASDKFHTMMNASREEAAMVFRALGVDLDASEEWGPGRVEDPLSTSPDPPTSTHPEAASSGLVRPALGTTAQGPPSTGPSQATGLPQESLHTHASGEGAGTTVLPPASDVPLQTESTPSTMRHPEWYAHLGFASSRFHPIRWITDRGSSNYAAMEYMQFLRGRADWANVADEVGYFVADEPIRPRPTGVEAPTTAPSPSDEDRDE